MDAAIAIGSVAAAGEVTRARAGGTPALGAGTAAGRYELAGYALAGALAGTGATTATAHALCVLRSGETDEPWPALAAARALFLGDETGEAVTGLRTLVDRCEQRQEAWGECQVRAARAVLLLRIGEVDEALRDADRAGHLATHRRSGPALLARAHAAQAAVLLARSQVARARVLLDAVETRWIEDDVWEYPQFLVARAAADAAHGDTDAGLGWLRRCGEVLTTAGVRNPLLAPWWVDAALALGPLGRTGEAAALAEEYDELCQRWNTPRSLGMALLARGAAATGRTRLHLLGAGAEALRAGPVSAYLIRLLLLLGRSLYERGDKAGARTHLRDALGLAARHGFTTLATLARDELRMAGGRAGSGTDVGALTASERAVAELAAGGATNRQIAERLFVTVRTVEFHLTNVYRRFGIRHRAQLPDVLKAPGTPTERADR
jgi:DNA-binding CsgD family transcriptional regulator